MKFLFMFLICCFCMYNISYANSEIVVNKEKGDFTVANLQDTGNKVKFDLFVRGKASSVVEIYDKNGKRVGYKVAQGTRASSSFTDGTIDIIKKPFLPGYGQGNISSNVSQKNSIEFDIPKGGSFKITKSSNLAIAVNLTETALEILAKVGLPEKYKNNQAFLDSLTNNLLNSMISRPIDIIKNSDYDGDAYLSQVWDFAKSMIFDAGGEALSNMAKELGKKSLSNLISSAEFAVLGLETDMVRMNINKHISNPVNNSIVADHTPDSFNDKNKNKIANLREKDKKINVKIKSINSREEDLKNLKEELEIKKSELSSMNKYTETKDEKKAILLGQANTLINANKGIPFKDWNIEDRVKLGNIGVNLGLSVKGNYGKGLYLFNQFKLKGYDWVKNRYITNETVENFEYNRLENNIGSLTLELNALIAEQEKEKNELKLLELNKLALISNIEDSTDDYNNDSKEALTSEGSNPEGKWLGISINHVFNKTTDALVSTTSSLYQPGGYDDIEDEDEILDVSLSGSVNKVTFDVNGLDSDSINANENFKTMNVSNSNGLTVEVEGYNENYMAWGKWNDETVTYSGSSDRALRESYWIAGHLTPNSDIPQSGSATYNGSLIGTNTTTSSNVTGSVAITTDFGTKTMSGVLDVTGFATAHLNSVNIHTGTKGTVFSGDLTGVNISSGNIAGAFYGDNAKAVGGVWAIDKTDSSHAAGVFNAKK